MASSYTQNLRTENPVPGDPAVRNAWGTIENTGRSLLDTAIAGAISISVAGNSNVTLTQIDGGADQSRNQHYIFTGLLTGNISVFWPVYGRAFSVFNNTTGAFSLTVAVVGAPGTTVAVPQGSTMLLLSDGTNISQRIVGSVGGTAGVLTLPAGPDTLVGRSTTDTLTNKTLTSPVVNTPTLNGSGGALTLPAGPDTIVGRATTDSLTNKTLSGGTLSGVSLTGNTTLPGSGQLSSAGLLGLGMTPTNVFDVTQNQSAASIIKLLNNSAGAAAVSEFQLANGTSTANFRLTGTGFTPTALEPAGTLTMQSNGPGGISIFTQAAQPIRFGINTVVTMTMGTQGGLANAVGVTASTPTGTPVTIYTPAGSASGLFLVWANISGAGSSFEAWAIVFYDPNGGLVNRLGGNNGANLTIATSGANIVLTQISGVNQVMEYSVTRFGG